MDFSPLLSSQRLLYDAGIFTKAVWWRCKDYLFFTGTINLYFCRDRRCSFPWRNLPARTIGNFDDDQYIDNCHLYRDLHHCGRITCCGLDRDVADLCVSAGNGHFILCHDQRCRWDFRTDENFKRLGNLPSRQRS